MSRRHSARSRRAQILGGVVAAALAVSAFSAIGAQAARGDRKDKHAKHDRKQKLEKREKKQKKVKPSVTKMRFKLDDHSVTAGEMVTGLVKVLTGRGRNRVALAGAQLQVKVDGVDAGTLVTGEDGTAVVSVLAEEGEHVVKVVYHGDETHKSARRAQGFEAVAPVEEVSEVTPELV